MKLRSQLQFVIAIAFIAISVPVLAQKKWPGLVLYNIELNGISKNLIVDPVVRISKGKFSYPTPIPSETWEKADANKALAVYFDKFCREEYPKGRKLDLYIDGNKCGSVTITQLDTLQSCSPVVSEVIASITDTVSHPFLGHGLVIASLPSKKVIQKFPVDSVLEQSILEYGKGEFLKHDVEKKIVGNSEIKLLRAIDIDGDGKPEYLVNYFILGPEVKHGELESNMQYSLTLILKKTPDGYKQLFSHYPEPGLGEETHLYKFIDVIDLDGDGICEVIVQQITSMTAWDYILLKKKGDVWEQVYEGAGGGC